jgi:hypothetical protein
MGTRPAADYPDQPEKKEPTQKEVNMGIIGGLNGIDIVSGVAQDGPDEFHSFISVRATGKDEDGKTRIVLQGQLSVDEVIETAMAWLKEAAAAEQDRMVIQLLMRDADLDLETAGNFVAGLREERLRNSEAADTEPPAEEEASPDQDPQSGLGAELPQS